jgi:3-oxoacyl-[acyl-carrier protein] reductase
MPVEDWDEVIRVNLRSAFLVTKHALRAMIRRRYGRLLYVSSVAAVLGNTGQAGYAASKAALHGLSHTVAQEYSRFDIRSLVVAPGMLNTGLGAVASPDIQQNKIDHSLLGTGSAMSVAQTIAFLVGPEADHINGTVVRIDGGLRY